MNKPINRAQLRFNWQRAKQRLDAAKAEEMRWRILMANEFLPIDAKLGTNYSDDGTVKIITKENVTLDKDKNRVSTFVNGVQQKHTINLSHVFFWQWSFSESNYRDLPHDVQLDLAPILTIKAATPVVEIVKEKK